ncbi:MAG TPA: hypothetical protein DEG17_08055 [Cyanobacteria bacterium UBA11149]|nr:hypothetical protein [Cyanobacteria bacterium UBA11367]HBE56398.1 hypothetical protein [Cyanobacteria bacterium UBA11366]HBK66619.1 hypothetical protein [Cyanobacteria bacterium UBA11166]HBR76349.1 hypothetical protein [Cyanobacteria bacterium UBA11159]HBS71545.1 hypothetical protein [Cyanobacteria bacterium UBA11153]HBW88814.1 hypothetical protein [Cyanobacteria bacterium UBA11149]HCA94183.1 hypothetical protein [Cyanobacteria bacterium UBA9226]
MLLEILNSKDTTVLSEMDPLSSGQFEFWFQPVYHSKTGIVLHNEVLLRWRDDEGNLHLPQEFFPSISRAGQLTKLDQIVIKKATELLAQQPNRCLSFNLSGEDFNDFSLIEYIETVLDQSGVDPKQLSFELTESTIAQNFTTARAFIRELKSLGCTLVLDNFANRELTLFQCQQLAVDLIKVDGQLIQQLKTEPTSRVLTKAILEGVKALGPVTAKFITDGVILELVKEENLNYVQGHHLKSPSPEPDWMEWTGAVILEVEEPAIVAPPFPWKRVFTGTGFVLLGIAVAAIGIASIGYRLGTIGVDGGLINGRIVRLRAPIDGKVSAFYAQPGATVKTGQVLARIQRSQAEEQSLLQLEGIVRENISQLESARRSLTFLYAQLQNVDNQEQSLRQVDKVIASIDVNQQEATLETAKKKAEAARIDYERYNFLYKEGAISQQQVDLRKFTWDAAELEIKKAEAALRSSQTSLLASDRGIALNNQQTLGSNFADQKANLIQEIQTQVGEVNTLQAKISTSKAQLQQAQSLYSKRQDMEVPAPLTGVIYTTDREEGEEVNQSEPFLTLLDCNELWIESVVSAKEASQIDPNKPVKVTLAGYTEPLTGKLDLVQPISSIQGIEERTRLIQVQALMPAIPPQLVGQPLARVTVRIPPPPSHHQSQQFCGLGQTVRLNFTKKPISFNGWDTLKTWDRWGLLSTFLPKKDNDNDM